ncbi:hypothetical protein FOTG_07609 [Fusarium oxysporum f. sp. vasinfectum 25433]|uniref:Uncharacterized protein n=1 Tax=Fusarium oxysporum f. sp. vasinfectum 25433 TaxID=1089449 RepID=X0LXI1_FUSOX|nr:hypothetical protein FOTG_07609 [Fusarium oxysporum f. sp. vasinfectum 25433]
MQLLTYIIPEQSLLLRSSPFVSGSQPPAPSVLDRSATAAAPASAPRTGASRDHGLGSAQASHARAHGRYQPRPSLRITPYNPIIIPRRRHYLTPYSLPRLFSLFFEIPLARPHPFPAHFGIPRNDLPHYALSCPSILDLSNPLMVFLASSFPLSSSSRGTIMHHHDSRPLTFMKPVSGQASSGPHDHRPLPPSGQIMWLSNSIFNLVFRFGATKPKLSVPCSLSHAGCKYLT